MYFVKIRLIQSLGGGIFDRLQLFLRTKFRFLSDFQVQNAKITIFPIFRAVFPFSQHCPLFATLFRRVKVLRKGVPPVYLFQFTTFSRIHFDWTFYFANILRIHFPFCEKTMDQLKVPLNSLFFSQISFEFTLSFANKLRINYLFRKIATYSANIPWIHYLFCHDTMNSLSY